MYLRPIFSNNILPLSGQLVGGVLGISGCFSFGNDLYSSTLSTDMSWFATSADCLIPHCMRPVNELAWVIARPTSPPWNPRSAEKKSDYKASFSTE